MSTDEYVPDEEQVRAWCREGAGDYPDVMDEWIARFLARVRRDAADEAWTDCVSEASALGWLHPSAALDMLDRNPHKETPRFAAH